MKVFLFLSLFTLVACQAEEAPTTTQAPSAVTAEEDCDDKAKQKVEIKEEGISLSGGDAGCTLDEPQK